MYFLLFIFELWEGRCLDALHRIHCCSFLSVHPMVPILLNEVTDPVIERCKKSKKTSVLVDANQHSAAHLSCILMQLT